MALTVLTELGIDVANDIHDVFVSVPIVFALDCFGAAVHIGIFTF